MLAEREDKHIVDEGHASATNKVMTVIMIDEGMAGTYKKGNIIAHQTMFAKSPKADRTMRSILEQLQSAKSGDHREMAAL